MPDDEMQPSDLAGAAAAYVSAMGDGLMPVFEYGMGLRTNLEAAGWSPTMAETMAAQVAMQLVTGLLVAAAQKNANPSAPQ